MRHRIDDRVIPNPSREAIPEWTRKASGLAQVIVAAAGVLIAAISTYILFTGI